MTWREHASCRDRDPTPWLCGDAAYTAAARAICMACPVREVCLSEQLDYERTIGQRAPLMFGGRTAYERTVILRHREGLPPVRRGRPRVAEMLGFDGHANPQVTGSENPQVSRETVTP